MSLYKKLFPDPLILFLGISLVLAYIFPQLSFINYKGFDINTVIDIGVLIVFFFYGLKLKWNEVFKDLLNWKLHVRIQLITFLLFPLLGFIFYPMVMIDEQFYVLFLALFYLCCLPSTVSSSVVMVSLAKGNVTSAIFNASLSGLLGIIFTPLWISLVFKQDGDFDSSSIFFSLILNVVLPVVLGAILQPYLGKLYDKYKTTLVNVDKLTIILIVYTSFSHTFQENLLGSVGVLNLLITIFGVVILFFIVFYLIQFLNNRFWKYNKQDFIAIQFCGTKKSLVHGSVMGSVIFGSEIGIFLLPIMVYHTFQLLFISYKATQYANEME